MPTRNEIDYGVFYLKDGRMIKLEGIKSMDICLNRDFMTTNRSNFYSCFKNLSLNVEFERGYITSNTGDTDGDNFRIYSEDYEEIDPDEWNNLING